MVLALFPVAAFAADGYFKDVGGTLAAEINKAYEAGLVTGYKDGTFRPNEPVTRAAFAKMIVLAVEKATGEELPGGDEPFSDVRPGQALYEFVVKAYNKGYIKGYPDGTFGYNKTINRQEAAAILQRALDLPLKAENFKDVPDNSGFAKQIGAVAAAGIMKGYGAEFKPAELLNRAQAAAVAYRAFEYLGGKKPEEKLYEVTVVEQASDSSLRVKFNQAVEDTSAVQFDVKRDGQAVQVTPEWAQDKTSVELKAQAKLQPGTYTVTVSGLKFAEGKNSGQVTIEGYEVVSVTAVSASALRVTFNKAVEDTSAVQFDVKRDGKAVALTPQWAQDKKSVDLKSSTKLQAGTYTVTVSGLDFAEGKNTGSVKVEAERIAKIEFLTDQLIISATDNKQASTSYRVYNQYGEDVTKNATGLNWTAVIVPGNVQANNVAGDANTGKVTVTYNAGFTAGQQRVVLTVVDPNTGVSASKTFEVAAAPTVASIAFGNLLLPQGDTRLYAGKQEAGRIEVVIRDQYGQQITDASAVSSAVKLAYPANLDNATSGITFARFQNDPNDGKLYVYLDTRAVQSATKVALTAVATATGASATITLDIAAQPYPADVELGAIEGVVAEGDTQFFLPLTVYDQFGEKMSAQAVLDYLNAHQNAISVTATGGLANALQIGTKDGALGITLQSGKQVGSKGTAVIVVSVPATGDSETLQIQVQSAREAASLFVADDIVTRLLVGATSSFEVKFKDQYGAEYSFPQSYDHSNDNLSYEAQLTGNTSAISVGIGTGTGAVQLNKDNPNGGTTNVGQLAAINVTATAEGTATLVVRLVKDGEPISQVSVTFTVAKATGALTYTIEPIPTLWRGANSASSPYAETVKVVAKDAQGNVYAVKVDDIVAVRSSDENAVRAEKVNGVWKVYGVGTVPAQDATVTITVVFNTADDVKELTTQVQASGAQLRADKLSVLDKRYDAPDGKAKTSVTLQDNNQNVGTGAYLVVTDQFGRKAPAVEATGTNDPYNAVTLDVRNESGFPTGVSAADIQNALSIDADGQVKVDLNQLAKDASANEASFRVVATTGNGKVAYFTVVIK